MAGKNVLSNGVHKTYIACGGWNQLCSCEMQQQAPTGTSHNSKKRLHFNYSNRLLYRKILLGYFSIEIILLRYLILRILLLAYYYI